MTTTSFTNYKEHVEYGIYFYSKKLNTLYTNGTVALYHQMILSLLIMYNEILSNYTLVTEEVNDEDYVDNFLTPTEMQTISEFINRILGINYVIDFLLTENDVYLSVPAFIFPGINEKDVAETKQTIL